MAASSASPPDQPPAPSHAQTADREVRTLGYKLAGIGAAALCAWGALFALLISNDAILNIPDIASIPARVQSQSGDGQAADGTMYFEVRDVEIQRDIRNGVEVLIIDGEVENITQTPLRLAHIRVRLFDANGEVAAERNIDMGPTELSPAERRPLRVEFDNPPPTARQANFDFYHFDDS